MTTEGKTDLAGLPEKWRAKAQEARGWADQLAEWDGANRHELRNRSGVYDKCADAILAAALVQGETQGPPTALKAAWQTLMDEASGNTNDPLWIVRREDIYEMTKLVTLAGETQGWQPWGTAPTNLRLIVASESEMAMAWLDRIDDHLYYSPQGGRVTWVPMRWRHVPAPPTGETP